MIHIHLRQSNLVHEKDQLEKESYLEENLD